MMVMLRVICKMKLTLSGHDLDVISILTRQNNHFACRGTETLRKPAQKTVARFFRAWKREQDRKLGGAT